MRKSLYDVRLSTTGVHTYIAVIALLSDNTTFIYHISPLKFNVNARDARKKVQRFIEETIIKLNKCKESNSSVQHVYIIGGLNTEKYCRLNTVLCLLKEDSSTVVRIFE
ncbi:unnamed protein product [Rotaria sp. Silwood2]|nr:unnamed protein product [Rotaria sp. Silwood2]CAF3441044.1 unnamed protein product [Rotaria sp. Silwood2]CAF4496497.1 unnamed protein product [Rotaria sp. Silwood2]